MEKQLIPQLRFPEFEEVWEKSKIGNEFTLFNGYAFSSSDSLKSDGALWVKIADVGIDKMETDNLSYLPYKYVEKYKKFVLSEGDYVVALTRPILSGNLKIARINKYFNNSLLNQRVAKLITNNDSTFIYNLLKGNRLIKSIENNIAGSDPPNLSPNDINHIKINIPQLPEQQKIATFLTDVDDKITKLTKKKTLLEQYKKGIMQKLFNQTLRFKPARSAGGDDDGNDYLDWEEKRLLDFCSFFSGGTPSSTNREFYSGKIPFIGSGNIYDSEVFNFISEEALNSSSAKMVKKGDLLYALYGANSGEVSISKLAGAINQAILCIRTKQSNEYLYYVLLFNKDRIVSKYLQGGQGNLSAQIIKKLKYEFPTLPEQTKIANFLSDIDLKIEAINTKIENSKTFKKGLLQKMFV